MWQSILLTLLGKFITPAMMQAVLKYFLAFAQSVALRTNTKLDDAFWAAMVSLSNDPNVLAHLVDFLTALVTKQPLPPVIDPLNPPPVPAPQPERVGVLRWLVKKLW